jgi:hypothetical protein
MYAKFFILFKFYLFILFYFIYLKIYLYQRYIPADSNFLLLRKYLELILYLTPSVLLYPKSTIDLKNTLHC